MIERMDTAPLGSNSKKSLLPRERVVILVLGLAVLAQLVLLLRVGILPLREQVRSVRDLPALERSAILSFGDSFSAYVQFLTEAIPEDATVVVPPDEVDSVLGHEGLMQYFLFPRRITNCPRSESPEVCIERMKEESAYFLAVGEYPPRFPLESWSSMRSFDERRGVFAPNP